MEVNGERTGTVVTFRDVSERLELDRMKEEFVANISHDLRTPLTAVRGYIDAIREGESGPLTDAQRADLAIVYRNIARLEAMIDDLLLVSRLEARKVGLNRRPFDLAATIRGVADTSRAVCRERGIDMALEVPDELEGSGDQRQVERAISNLVTNAIKSSLGGTTITLRAQASSGGGWCVEVADQGGGIPEDEIPRLAERFYRASNAHAVGSGLGLAITREIAELHGGRLEIISEVGKGSTFAVVVPAELAPPGTRRLARESQRHGLG